MVDTQYLKQTVEPFIVSWVSQHIGIPLQKKRVTVGARMDGTTVRFEDRNKIRKITLKVNSDISSMPFRPEDFHAGDYFVREILETGVKIV